MREPLHIPMKDDKTYPYIKVTVYEDFPRVLFSRDMKTLDNKKSVEKPTITKGTEKTGTTTDRKEKESRPVVLIAVVAVVLVLVTGAVAWIKYKQAKSRRHRRKRHRRKTSQKDKF